VGQPGIGKSRLVGEAAKRAAARGVDMFFSFCESHAVEVPFLVVARLLRSVFDIDGMTLAGVGIAGVSSCLADLERPPRAGPPALCPELKRRAGWCGVRSGFPDDVCQQYKSGGCDSGIESVDHRLRPQPALMPR